MGEAMDPERVKQLSTLLKTRLQSPDLTPEQVKQTIETFRSLPTQRKQLISKILKNSCSFCEEEFKIPNIVAKKNLKFQILVGLMEYVGDTTNTNINKWEKFLLHIIKEKQ